MTDHEHPEYLPQADWDAVEAEVDRLAAERLERAGAEGEPDSS